jgi:hypothetical protein
VDEIMTHWLFGLNPFMALGSLARISGRLRGKREKSAGEREQSQSLKRRMTILSPEVFLQSILKDLAIGCGMGKQSHGRPKLQIVRVSKNLMDCSSCSMGDQFRSLN